MQTDMKALARLGAQLRIAELFAEIEALIDAFPGLGKTPLHVVAPAEVQEDASGKRRRASRATKTWVPAQTPAPRRALSPSARARIVAAQKKRWAAFRKKNKKH